MKLPVSQVPREFHPSSSAICSTHRFLPRLTSLLGGHPMVLADPVFFITLYDLGFTFTDSSNGLSGMCRDFNLALWCLATAAHSNNGARLFDPFNHAFFTPLSQELLEQHCHILHAELITEEASNGTWDISSIVLM